MKNFQFLVVLLLFFCAFEFAYSGSEVSNNMPSGKSNSRVALIIGNGDYKSSPLKNPPNDAEDMAKALKLLGFDIIIRRDTNQREMKAAVREFGQKLRGAEAGLFYYAGHGIQMKGINYLVPIEVDIQSEADAEDQTVSLDYVMRTMEESGAKFNIAILDACRNNPFARSFRSAARGLASTQAANGMLIAYATAPGSVAADGEGRNGIYTKYLLENLNRGDRDILKLFQRVRNDVAGETNGKQIPWESTSMVGEFNLGPASAYPEYSKGEIVFWESIKNSHRPQDFNAYIEKFPNGTFHALAMDRISEFGRNKSAISTLNAPSTERGVSDSPAVEKIIMVDPLASMSSGVTHIKNTDGNLSCSDIERELESLEKSHAKHINTVESSQSSTDATEGAVEVGKVIGIPFSNLLGKIANRNNRAKEKSSMQELTYITKRRDHLTMLTVMRNCSNVTSKMGIDK